MIHKCLFCNKTKQKIVSLSDYFFVVRDSYPVTKLHTLIIPHRHVSNFFDLTKEESKDLNMVLKKFSASKQIISFFWVFIF